MFLSYQVMATFGVSALTSFAVSVSVLLVLAARRGLLRAGAGADKPGALLAAPPPPSVIAELMPLKQKI